MKKLLHSLSNILGTGRKNPNIEKQMRAFAYNRYPNNQQAQDYIFSEEMNAYRQMKMVSDIEVKTIAAGKYPHDFAMQQYVYNNQLEAKRYMNELKDSPAKQEAIRRYPHDYSTQKFIYGQLAKVTKRSA